MRSVVVSMCGSCGDAGLFAWRCGPIRRAREMRVMELTLRSALRFHWTSPVARRRVQVERHYN